MKNWTIVAFCALTLIMVSDADVWARQEPKKVPTERAKFLERSYTRTWGGVTENGGFDPYAVNPNPQTPSSREGLEAEKREATKERERLRAEWAMNPSSRDGTEKDKRYDIESIEYTRPERRKSSDETRHPGRNGDWKPRVGERGTFIASWYGDYFHGEKTASGERYDMFALTAAHRMLPFGTKVKITNPENGVSIVVAINDWGPDVAPREIDVSRAAAEALGFRNEGAILLVFEIVEIPS